MSTSYQHWRVEPGENYTTVYFDMADSQVNVFNQATMRELSLVLKHVTAQPKLKAVVFRSAKAKGFIAGADITAFSQISTVNDAVADVREGQQIFEQLAAIPVPTIAVMHDFALGGGLEFALACDYRITDDDPRTRLGFLETRVGIHPGWGGTTRLPKLIGGLAALMLMLSGRTLHGGAAKAMGLVDYAIPKCDVDRAIAYLLTALPPAHKPSIWQRWLGFAPLRPIVAGLLRRRVAAKIKDKDYPAPFALLNLWQRYGGYGEVATIAEANSVAKLLVTPTAKSLARVFLLRERLRELGKTESGVKHVHVVGAGTMGGDIAAWCALHHMKVTLEDADSAQLGRSMARAVVLFQRKCKQKHRVQAARDNLIMDPKGYGRAHADLIIEAIVEDKSAKQALWQALVQTAKPDAILATNTSSISLTELSEGWANPARLIGLHFFNPVERMPLVEVVETSSTAPELAARAFAFVKSIDKLPLPVANEPGFLVNRILSAYMLAAVGLHAQGYSYAQIDGAALAFGMAMGPIELADTVGLDICLAAAKTLVEKLSLPMPTVLAEKVKAGELGRKTGKGFYTYIKGQRREKIAIPASPDARLVEALMVPLKAEASAALADGVVSDADLVDAGMIFGAGYPPFRGGPLYVAVTG